MLDSKVEYGPGTAHVLSPGQVGSDRSVRYPFPEHGALHGAITTLTNLAADFLPKV